MIEETTLYVIDTNAKAAPRQHEIPVRTDPETGAVLQVQTYKLQAEAPTPMPEEHAMFFLRDPAFQVFDCDGNVIQPVAQREGGLGGVQLKEGEVIATLDELAKEALFKRCKILTGSDRIKANTSKEDMIAFLLARGKAETGKSRGSEHVIAEMDTAALDNLLAA